MAIRSPLPTLAILAALLAGCGQKGPLYLPEEETAPVADEPAVMPSEQLPVEPLPRELGTPGITDPGLEGPAPVPQAVIPLEEDEEPEAVEEAVEPPPPGL